MTDPSASFRPYHERVPYRLADGVLRALLRLGPPNRLAERIALWWGPRFGPVKRVVRLRGGGVVLADTADYVQLLVYYLGVFEPHCVRIVRRLLPRGGVFVDVGAHIGCFTIQAARIVGHGGRVIAVEAAPTNAALLRANIERNALLNVSLAETAVGRGEGTAVLSLPAGANQGMYTLGATGDSTRAQAVRVRSLDAVLADLGVGRVDLVKMDVEGAESEVLRGGQQLLHGPRPPIIVEVNEPALARLGAGSGDLLNEFKRAEYRGWVIEPRGLMPLGAGRAFTCDECVFVPRERTDLAHRLGVGVSVRNGEP